MMEKGSRTQPYALLAVAAEVTVLTMLTRAYFKGKASRPRPEISENAHTYLPETRGPGNENTSMAEALALTTVDAEQHFERDRSL
jgi:hypothetical protein